MKKAARLSGIQQAMQDLRAAAPKPPQRAQRVQRARSGRATPPTPQERAAPHAARSVRTTIHLPQALVDEAKNCVVALSGPPWRLTLAGLMRDALALELARLKDGYHGGKPWPPRSKPLVGGRPLKG